MEKWRTRHVGDMSIVCDVQRNNNEVSLRMANGRLHSAQEYLDMYIPSRECSASYFWILNDDIPRSEINFPAMTLEWGKLTARFERNPRRIKPSHIFQIAKRYSYKSGKWISYHKAGEPADSAWKLVVKGIEGELKTTAMAAYINMCKHDIPGTAAQCVICIFNEDYTNEHQMNSIENVLRNAGIGAQHGLRYKLDIYTEFGIYPNNVYGLAPTIH